MYYVLRYLFMFRYADSISNGDEVLVGGIDNLTPSKVINVSSLMMQGKHCLIPIRPLF